jgi:hypothetical protein
MANDTFPIQEPDQRVNRQAEVGRRAPQQAQGVHARCADYELPQSPHVGPTAARLVVPQLSTPCCRSRVSAFGKSSTSRSS